MNTQKLIDTAKALVADDKGLLAMDESNPTCNKRFAKLVVPQTVEARGTYRELIVTTPGLSTASSGPSSQMQPCSAPWRIQCGNGKNLK
jgi:fructose-bisphosphate aldolase class I